MLDINNIASFTGGEILGSNVSSKILGFSIDSRNIKEGYVFIAIKGDNFDGHDFIYKAFDNGAIIVISEKEVQFPIPNDKSVILVEDCLKALYDIAYQKRRLFKGKLIAITGSVGKTTLKELLNHLLSDFSKSYATVGNLNNHFGVPLTLANMPLDAQYAIVEIGMNHSGEILPLSQLCRPDIAVIANVYSAHKAFFESLNEIAKAKAEIMSGLNSDGALIISADTYLDVLLKEADNFFVSNIKTVGSDLAANYLVKKVEQITQSLSEVTLVTDEGDSFEFSVATSTHNGINFAFAFAVLRALKLTPELKRFGTFIVPKGRGQVNNLVVDGKSFTLIDESYNASPESMKATLNNFMLLPIKDGRKHIVLSDMLELGVESSKYHQELIPLLENFVNGSILWILGDEMHNIANHFLNSSKNGLIVRIFDNVSELGDSLLNEVESGDMVFVKGSYSSGAHKVVEVLFNKTYTDKVFI